MKFWSDTIRKIAPYVPGEQPLDKKYIKLNTNENPYPPSPSVLEAIAAETCSDIRLYPDPNASALKEAIANHYQVKANEVFVGNGSDEVLAFSFPAFFNPGDTISFPEITYSFYPVYADLFHVRAVTVAMNEDFTFNPDSFPEGMKGILLANPNAPTGIAVGLDVVERLLNRFPDTLIIVDEAYVDFGGQSAIPLINRYENLLVIHTFSKSRALAGLRIGYAIGNAALIEGLERVKNSFNSYTLDMVAQSAAIAAVNDPDYTRRTCERIVNTRESTRAKLLEMGCNALPSSTNFLFVSHPNFTGKELLLKLKQEGILVRNFQKSGIENWLRISIGTDEEMTVFIEKLEAIVTGQV
ncbi:MAG: histidinol-phosphate transaminase [Ruminiclostridium sp.]|nr:histidinol-phosphate transaminase [Ruminiclostridium sp.]